MEVTNVEIAVKEATPENIAAAESDVTSKEAAVSVVETALTEENTAQTEANTAVKAQEEAVFSAEKVVTEKQATVETATQDVATKQAILDGTGIAAVVKAAEEARADLTAKEAAKASADKELVSAQQSDDKRQATIENLTKEKSEKEVALATATSDLTTKTAAVNQTEQTLASKQADLTKAQEAVASINKITLSPEYVTALKEYYTLAKPSDKIIRKLTELSKELGRQNQFISLSEDKLSQKWDVNNLPVEVQTNLTLFTADLLNQIHQAFGTSKVVVSTSPIAIIKEHTTTSDRNGVRGHDTANLKKILSKYSIDSDTEENIALQSHFPETATTDELKHLVYNALTNFLFSTLDGKFFAENIEWNHAGSIAGLSLFEGEEPTVQYLGVSISRKDDLWGITNFLFVNETPSLRSNSKFDKSEITNPYDSKALLAALTVAQTAYNKAESANDSAQADKSTAQAAVTQAQAALAQATEKLAAAEAVEVLTPTAQKAAEAAQTVLTAAQERNNKAQAALASLNADVKSKQAALAQAKAVLAEKQADLTAAQVTLKAEQGTLASRKAAAQTAANLVATRKNELAAAKATLSQAKERVEFLKNAPVNLAKAQSDLKEAQATLAEKKTVLEAEIKKLEALKAEQADLTTQFAKVEKAYQDYLETQRQVKLAAEKATIEKAGKTAVPVIDGSGQVVGYTEAKPAGQPTALSQTPLSYGNSAYKASPAKVQAQAILPATGSESTSTVLILGMALGLATTLVGFKKKEEN